MGCITGSPVWLQATIAAAASGVAAAAIAANTAATLALLAYIDRAHCRVTTERRFVN